MIFFNLLGSFVFLLFFIKAFLIFELSYAGSAIKNLSLVHNWGKLLAILLICSIHIEASWQLLLVVIKSIGTLKSSIIKDTLVLLCFF